MNKLLSIAKRLLPSLRFISRRKSDHNISICLGPDNYSYRLFFTSFKKNLPNELRKYLVDRDCFVDVGANIGWYSLAASKVFTGEIISIEPSRETYVTLTKNIQNNGLNNRVCLLNVAVTSQFRIVHLSDYSAADQNKILENKEEKCVQKVVGLKLDFLKYYIRKGSKLLIKIDVEGHESSAIESAYELLTTFDVILLIEVEFGQFLSLDEKLKSIGFRLDAKSKSSKCFNCVYFNSTF